MSDAVPLAIGPVRGWRAWRLKTTPHGALLCGVVDRSPWPIGMPATAACNRGCPDPPGSTCRCGLHATRDLDHALGYTASRPRSDDVVVFGEVDLWGTVVEGERGWRASHAYPHRIVLPAWWATDPAQLLTLGICLCDYGVPVHVLDIPRLAVTSACAVTEDRLGALIARDIARAATP